MCLGIPGCVIEIVDRENALGVVDISGVKRVINLACVLPATDISTLIGTWVLIHVGFAISVIDEDEAVKTLELLSGLEAFSDDAVKESY